VPGGERWGLDSSGSGGGGFSPVDFSPDSKHVSDKLNSVRN